MELTKKGPPQKNSGITRKRMYRKLMLWSLERARDRASPGIVWHLDDVERKRQRAARHQESLATFTDEKEDRTKSCRIGVEHQP